MNKKDFAKSLKEKLHSFAIDSGFKSQSDLLFTRFHDTHEIDVIFVQAHSLQPKVCLNFGVHFDFMVKVGTNDLPAEKIIRFVECEIKTRITPESTLRDYWWDLQEPSVDEIVNLIDEKAESFFSKYKVNGKLSKLTLSDFKDGVVTELASLTKVRACLVLAKIHAFLNQPESALNFAEYGLEIAGVAVGPKKQFREIIKTEKSE